jgi:hypothetical protein
MVVNLHARAWLVAHWRDVQDGGVKQHSHFTESIAIHAASCWPVHFQNGENSAHLFSNIKDEMNGSRRAPSYPRRDLTSNHLIFYI